LSESFFFLPLSPEGPFLGGASGWGDEFRIRKVVLSRLADDSGGPQAILYGSKASIFLGRKDPLRSWFSFLFLCGGKVSL